MGWVLWDQYLNLVHVLGNDAKRQKQNTIQSTETWEMNSL